MDELVLDTIFQANGEFTSDLFDLEVREFQVDDQVKTLEKEAVQLAEDGNMTLALEHLDSIISANPDYGSAYNNRAQVYRMLDKPELALPDLDRAIQVSTNPSVLSQAHTQRAILLRNLGKIIASEADFAAGARYGNKIAKNQVRNNPYAKMCAAMVQQMMRK